jgi:hypothetical protein
VIELDCKDNVCRAAALNGYQVISTVVPYKGDDGKMYIPIVKIPKSARIAILIDDGNDITFDFGVEKTVCGKVDMENGFPDVGMYMQRYDREPDLAMCFDPKVLRDALDAFIGKSSVKMQFFRTEPGCVISPKYDDIKALVLPMFPF